MFYHDRLDHFEKTIKARYGRVDFPMRFCGRNNNMQIVVCCLETLRVQLFDLLEDGTIIEPSGLKIMPNGEIVLPLAPSSSPEFAVA
jgi:hypothetical protein